MLSVKYDSENSEKCEVWNYMIQQEWMNEWMNEILHAWQIWTGYMKNLSSYRAHKVKLLT